MVPHLNNPRPGVSRTKQIQASSLCDGWLPALPSLFLPEFGEDEGDDEQADDDGQHAEGERQAQGPVHRVLAELSLVAKPAVAHEGGSAARGHLAGPVTVALGLPTGGQAVVNISGLTEQVRDGHGQGRTGRDKKDE